MAIVQFAAGPTFLGLGLALGSTQRPGSGEGCGCTAVFGSRRGRWTAGSFLVDSDHPFLSPLRFTVHRVQQGGSFLLSSPYSPSPTTPRAVQRPDGAPVIILFVQHLLLPTLGSALTPLSTARIAWRHPSSPLQTAATPNAPRRGGDRPWRTHGRARFPGIPVLPARY